MIALVKYDGVFLAMENVKSVKNLPKSSGVYVLSCDDEVLYVGESTNLRKRWASHDYSSFIGLRGVSLYYMECSDHKEVEKCFIKSLRPSFNGNKGNYQSLKRQSLETGKSVAEIRQAFDDAMPEEYKNAVSLLKSLSQKLKSG